MSEAELLEALAVLEGLLSSQSRIVRVNSLQALADLGLRFSAIRPHIMRIVGDTTLSSSPAVRARARKAMKQLELEEMAAEPPGLGAPEVSGLVFP
jgi:hypothetical protein